MQRVNTIIFGLLLATSNVFATSTQRITFTWSDINTRDVLRWEGDTAVIRQGSSMQELRCKVALDSTDIDAAIEQFGVPKLWTSLSYTDEKDLSEKQRALEAKASRHGIKMMENGNQFVVDYTWVIRESTKELRDVAKGIRSSSKKTRLPFKKRTCRSIRILCSITPLSNPA